MPRFFINFRSGNVTANDDEGVELASLQEAREKAEVSGREVLANDIKYASREPLLSVTVTNQAGTTLLSILAKDLLPEPLK